MYRRICLSNRLAYVNKFIVSDLVDIVFHVDCGRQNNDSLKVLNELGKHERTDIFTLLLRAGRFVDIQSVIKVIGAGEEEGGRDSLMGSDLLLEVMERFGNRVIITAAHYKGSDVTNLYEFQ